jgi:hypothetical protein
VGDVKSYDELDHEFIDYERFLLPEAGLLRGPAPRTLAPGEYFTCLGAAQTFGRYCEQPYPTLLAHRVGLPVLNLGIAGAGPRFFVGQKAMLGYVNAGTFAIVQIMSARGEDNSLFETEGRAFVTRRSDGARMEAALAYRELVAKESVERIQAVVVETRQNWLASFASLLEAIEVPTILLWFSERAPDYEDVYSKSGEGPLFGRFPQLVNRAMVEQVRRAADEYVECISARGLPQRLVSRLTSDPGPGRGKERYNRYYPSPEMHADAADALIEACRKYASAPDASAANS